MANDTCNIKLIVGLGNPGNEYEHTRHNIGVGFVYKLADMYKIDMRPEGKFSGIVGRGNIEGQEVRLVFPTTYMNESGRSVGALCNFRLRLGIGKPPSKEVINWVLGRPNSADQKLIDDAYEVALVSLKKLFTQGVSKFTSIINGYKPN